MSVMLKKELIPFAIMGYILASYLKMPVMGIALVAAAFAIKYFNDASKNQPVAAATGNGDEHDDWI